MAGTVLSTIRRRSSIGWFEEVPVSVFVSVWSRRIITMWGSTMMARVLLSGSATHVLGSTGFATSKKPTIENKSLLPSHPGPAVFAGADAAGALRFCEV
jgi:hypothetical protein